MSSFKARHDLIQFTRLRDLRDQPGKRKAGQHGRQGGSTLRLAAGVGWRALSASHSQQHQSPARSPTSFDSGPHRFLLGISSISTLSAHVLKLFPIMEYGGSGDCLSSFLPPLQTLPVTQHMHKLASVHTQ